MKLKTMMMAVALLAATGNVQARIGETMAESVQRYGPAIYMPTGSTDIAHYYFLKDGYRIHVGFGDDGKAMLIEYSKVPVPGEDGRFTDFEINNLLSKEGQGWVSSGLYEWRTDTLVAAYGGNPLTYSLIVATKQYVELMKQGAISRQEGL